MKCTNCKQPLVLGGPAVFSAGDYDPFCSQSCHDDYFKKLSEEMGRINKMTDEEFRRYMMPWEEQDDREQ